MTIATTRGTESSIAELVDDAYREAGIVSVELNPTVKQRVYGRRVLDRIMDELVTSGLFARSVVFSDHALTIGDYTYTMDDDVSNIVGDGMYIDATQTDLTKADGETVIKQMSLEEWNHISAKGAIGRPSRMLVYRAQDPIEVRLWPIPDEAGTMRLQEHRMPADATDGSTTPDSLPYWYQYFVTAVAAKVAGSSSMPRTRVNDLAKEAHVLRTRARGYANQNVSAQARVAHETAWNTRRVR